MQIIDYLGRYLLRDFIKEALFDKYRVFMAIDTVMEEEGYRIIFLMRITMIPFSVMSYLLGMTAVKFKDYFIGSLPIVFHIAFFLYLGSTFSQLDFDQQSSGSQA